MPTKTAAEINSDVPTIARGADLLPWGMVVGVRNEGYLRRTLFPIEKQRRDGGLSEQC